MTADTLPEKANMRPVILSGANGHGVWMARNDYEARQSACDPAAIWLAWLVMRDGDCR